MKLFKRELFDPETERKYFLPYFKKIEELNDTFIKMPNSEEVRFISESKFKSWIEEREYKKVYGTIVYEIFNRMKFLVFTNIFKTLKLIEALALMYNHKNFLGWSLIGRSVLEHSAVLYYYSNKLKNLNLLRLRYSPIELEEIETILIKFSNGSRFDWEKLLDGDVNNLTKNYDPENENLRAVNVLTALKHLSKATNAFRDIEMHYSIFSDFAHPNMASHSIFINLSENALKTGKNELALNVNKDRGEFILVATLPIIAICLGGIGDLIRENSKASSHWLDIVEGQKIITIIP